MKVEQIIRELKNFSNLPYCFDFNGNTISVVLGEHNCKKRDEYEESDISHFNKLISDMENLFNKEIITNDDKKTMGIIADRIRCTCDYRQSSIYTLVQQKEFLSQLDSTALDNLYRQIKMYKIAFEYYDKFRD